MASIASHITETYADLDASTKLSLVRTRLSGERTLMSWIRTAFSMISFGFTMGKFLEYLNTHPNGGTPLGDGRTLPTLLILLGLVSLFVGTWEFRHLVVEIDAVAGQKYRPTAVGIITILVALLGALAFVGLFVRIDFL